MRATLLTLAATSRRITAAPRAADPRAVAAVISREARSAPGPCSPRTAPLVLAVLCGAADAAGVVSVAQTPAPMRSTFVRSNDGTDEMATFVGPARDTYRSITPLTDFCASASTGADLADSPTPDAILGLPDEPANTFGDRATNNKLEAPRAPKAPSPFGRKGLWGKAYYGNIFHTPINFPYRFGKYWSRKFRMKKHRYTKRWRKRRYKVAALANMPFARKLRVSLLPRLNQGKSKAAELDGFGEAAQSHVSRATAGSTGGQKMSRSRPQSKYTN